MTKQSIGQMIKAAMEAQNISAYELGHKIEIPSMTIYNICNGKQVPTLKTLLPLQRALGIEVVKFHKSIDETTIVETFGRVKK